MKIGSRAIEEIGKMEIGGLEVMVCDSTGEMGIKSTEGEPCHEVTGEPGGVKFNLLEKICGYLCVLGI